MSSAAVVGLSSEGGLGDVTERPAQDKGLSLATGLAEVSIKTKRRKKRFN